MRSLLVPMAVLYSGTSVGDKHFVHCSEVVPYSEVEMCGSRG